VRRRLIRTVLPLAFCLVPPLAAGLIGVSLPKTARDFYFSHFTRLDAFIVVLGVVLFVVQTVMAWQAMRWRGRGFDETPDRWLSNLMQAAEWFPLLGLIGTVAGIMQTFAGFDNGGDVVSQQEVIARYASAITATCSGLFMALVNLLPGWMVTLGRDLIRSLGGGPPPADVGVEERPVARGAVRQPADGARV
jgi:Mn2+/Fe2+ NRAMP family transporter